MRHRLSLLLLTGGCLWHGLYGGLAAKDDLFYAPVQAYLKDRSHAQGQAMRVEVLDISHTNVYVVPPFDEVAQKYAYKTPFGLAMRSRHWAHTMPFERLDMKALSMDAPWIVAVRDSLAQERSAQRALRDLLGKLERPMLETSGVELPVGTIAKLTSIRIFLWQVSQKETSRQRLDILRANPKLLGPFWAYLCVARDEIKRSERRIPGGKGSALGAAALARFEELEIALGRLLMPRTPIGNDREQLQNTLNFIFDHGASPGQK